jgi:NTP pyrophosphatase (non-canonical NTP hydrolase)
MELFQWMPVEQSRRIADEADKYQQVQEELADVICYALALANELDIDLSAALAAKMIKNRAKYPSDTYQGKYEVQ